MIIDWVILTNHQNWEDNLKDTAIAQGAPMGESLGYRWLLYPVVSSPSLTTIYEPVGTILSHYQHY